jgi:hypothetical protein
MPGNTAGGRVTKTSEKFKKLIIDKQLNYRKSIDCQWMCTSIQQKFVIKNALRNNNTVCYQNLYEHVASSSSHSKIVKIPEQTYE